MERGDARKKSDTGKSQGSRRSGEWAMRREVRVAEFCQNEMQSEGEGKEGRKALH